MIGFVRSVSLYRLLDCDEPHEERSKTSQKTEKCVSGMSERVSGLKDF